MKKIYLCSAIAMALLTACQENEALVTVTPTETNDTEVIISATIEEEGTTRTHLGESNNDKKRQVLWDQGDTVAVFYRYDKPSKFTVKSGANSTYAKFSTRKIEKGNAIDHYVGLYPYDADATIEAKTVSNYTTYTVTTNFPAEQSYQKNSYGVGAAPMMAVATKTTNPNLNFKNMCTSVKINLKGTKTVSHIEIISLNTPIAGKHKYKYTLLQEKDESGDSIKIEIEPSESGAVNMITLDCGDGVQLNTETATGFIFTMPPRKFEDNELLFRVYYAEGGFADVYKQEGFTYERSKIVSVGGDGYECDKEEMILVATIGNKSFKTLDGALAAFAQDMSEANLSIYTDIYLGDAASQANSRTRSEVVLNGEEITRDQITIPAGKTLTLNLNGHSIRGEKACKGSFAMIENNGTLIITGNGTISFKDTGDGALNFGWGSYTILNRGTLTIENTSIFNESYITEPHVAYTIDNHGTLNIDGGEVIFEKGHALRMAAYSRNPVKTTIDDALIKGTRTIFVQLPSNDPSSAPEMHLTINGGKFIAGEEDGFNIYVYSAGQSGENVTINITDGIFNGYIAIDAVLTNSLQDKSVQVSGGIFTNEWAIFSYAEDDVAAPKIAITGGTFVSDQAACYAEDDGYQFVANGDGTYDVKKQQ